MKSVKTIEAPAVPLTESRPSEVSTKISPLRFRQVHMDFHTSELITSVAADFDAQAFASTLKKAHVNSVTCFARCHHGFLYYQSQKSPELIHPGLDNRDLLAEQVAACHNLNIKVPLYTTVRWDHYSATNHPEWLVASPEKKETRELEPCDVGFYQDLCLNSGYARFLFGHLAELMETFAPDGLFLDIVNPVPCICDCCREKMTQLEMNPDDQAQRVEFALWTVENFKNCVLDIVQKSKPDCLLFFNAGHIGTSHRRFEHCFTHFEIESLPGGAWGYGHFPATARYARTLGKDCMGMTGKFHTAWGDFHSYKNQAALEYECFHMLALNTKCSIGDQLHPGGTLCPASYDLIGKVYSQVQQKEPWCRSAVPLTDIGVLHPDEFAEEFETMALSQPVSGVTRMLQEGGHQFNIIDSQADLLNYKLLILPDHILIGPALKKKLTRFLQQGGKLIASFQSGLSYDKSGFAMEEFGITKEPNQPKNARGQEIAGEPFFANNFTDFVIPRGLIGQGLPETEHVMYIRGLNFKTAPKTDVLINAVGAYFDRTGSSFCSHRHTPSSGNELGPAVVRHGSIIYFGHPIFTIYRKYAPQWCKQMLLNAVTELLGQPLVEHDGPSFLVTTLNDQPTMKRWILHLLSYVPEKRCEELEIIEEAVCCCNLQVTIRTVRNVRSVKLVPEAKDLSFSQDSRGLHITLDKVQGHQMVEIQF